MWQVLLSIFRFGELSWLFSDVGMSGYTAGAGIHLFTSQIKSLLGLKMPRRIGPFVVLRVSRSLTIIVFFVWIEPLVIHFCFNRNTLLFLLEHRHTSTYSVHQRIRIMMVQELVLPISQRLSYPWFQLDS